MHIDFFFNLVCVPEAGGVLRFKYLGSKLCAMHVPGRTKEEVLRSCVDELEYLYEQKKSVWAKFKFKFRTSVSIFKRQWNCYGQLKTSAATKCVELI